MLSGCFNFYVQDGMSSLQLDTLSAFFYNVPYNFNLYETDADEMCYCMYCIIKFQGRFFFALIGQV